MQMKNKCQTRRNICNRRSIPIIEELLKISKKHTNNLTKTLLDITRNSQRKK